MNSEQFLYPSQLNCLPMSLHYTEQTSQGGQPLTLSFDGLPRSRDRPDGVFSSIWANHQPSDFAAMPLSQATTVWNGPVHRSVNFDDPIPDAYYQYSPPLQGNGFQSSSFAEVPRTWSLPYETQISSDNMVSNTFAMAGSSSSPTEAIKNPRDFTRPSISRSPKIEEAQISEVLPSLDMPSTLRMPSLECSDEDGNSSREMTVLDGEGFGIDEPYAKLIHRALMSTPSHSMVLQEIYQWFREHTTKGSSDTRGWMNSIRHNLSMNAVRKLTIPLEPR
jgi:hypothetical protein